MNIINKIFGIQYIKVTYKVTDKNPYTDEHEEPQVESIILDGQLNFVFLAMVIGLMLKL
ncbi:hypothetical protein G2540_00206 [Escherichia phage vB_EcoM_G2540]|nr:hypothetical protein G2540_00206 [Escherichia phage vB_EcoM_G2540]